MSEMIFVQVRGSSAPRLYALSNTRYLVGKFPHNGCKIYLAIGCARYHQEKPEVVAFLDYVGRVKIGKARKCVSLGDYLRKVLKETSEK